MSAVVELVLASGVVVRTGRELWFATWDDVRTGAVMRAVDSREPGWDMTEQATAVCNALGEDRLPKLSESERAELMLLLKDPLRRARDRARRLWTRALLRACGADAKDIARGEASQAEWEALFGAIKGATGASHDALLAAALFRAMRERDPWRLRLMRQEQERLFPWRPSPLPRDPEIEPAIRAGKATWADHKGWRLHGETEDTLRQYNPRGGKKPRRPDGATWESWPAFAQYLAALKLKLPMSARELQPAIKRSLDVLRLIDGTT